MFQGLGTPCQSAVRQYLNAKKVPQLFVSSGAEKWADPEHFPWTIGGQPSYRTEASIYAKHLMTEAPSAKLAVLYQNDDFGKDYLAGLRDTLGAKYEQIVVKTVSYETSDPTVDSQIVSLQSSGADAFLNVATPKFAAQAIKKVAELGWHPAPFYMSNVSLSAAAVMIPAGAENGKGVITGAYLKDQSDPQWADDPGMNELRAFVQKWGPELDVKDSNVPYGYLQGVILRQLLEQCGNDLSRENIMRQAASIHELAVPTLLPGIVVNTAPDNFHTIRQLQLARWSGSAWQRFGGVIGA